MSRDFRYHVASLCAVFLALGIGIFVGTAFVGAPAVDRQTRLIRRLEENVSIQMTQASEREKSEEALRGLLPALVQNKLTGRRVLIVQTGAFSAPADAAAETLRLAGAETVARVQLPASAWRALSDAAQSGTNTAPGDNPLDAQVERLAPALLNPTESTLRALHDAGLIAGESELTGGFRLILLVGGGAAEPASPATPTANSPGEPWPLTLARTRDVPLIHALQSADATVVGGESFDADLSFLPAYQSTGVSTIDALDRAVGQIALPFALLGEKGNYGYKAAAERVLPVSLTTPPTPAPSPAPPTPRPTSTPVPVATP